MANHVSHAALPYPIKGCRFTLAVPYLDADGDPTDPTTPDTERSIDAAAFADCTEEVTTITGSNGTGFITLTGDEMNGSLITVAAKVSSGPKATLATLYPRVLPVIYSGTATTGAAGTITLSATAPPLIDKIIVGCIIRTTGGTGGAGGSGSLGNQARVVTDYVASTRVVTVVPNWETTPDSTTTYEVMLTEVALITFADLKLIEAVALSTHASGMVPADVRDFGGSAGTFSSGRPEVNTTHLAGTSQTARDIGASVLLSTGSGAGQLDFTSGVVKANATQVDGATLDTHDAGSFPADVRTWVGVAPSALISGRVDANAQVVGDKTGYTATATLADGVTHGGTTAVLSLKSATVSPGAGNGDAVTVTGGAASGATPAGHGIKATGGAASTSSGGTAGSGVSATGGAGAASTNGSGAGVVVTAGGTVTVSGNSGLKVTGTGNGDGLTATGVGGGAGFSGQGGSSGGSGLLLQAAGGGHGIDAYGQGSGAGIRASGGSTNGEGIQANAFGTGSGINANCAGAGTGHGVKATAGGGTGGGHGIYALAQAPSANGIKAVGGDALTTSPAGHGISATGGVASTGAGGTAGTGIVATGGAGAASTNGSGAGTVMTGGGTTTVAGNDGLQVAGTAAGAGMKATGGATGHGLSTVGGATSGDGFRAVATTSGHGITATGVGTSKHGLVATGGTGGTSDGVKGAAGTGGVDIRGAITGNITGDLSGAVGSVTGAVGSVTGAVGSVTGAVGSVTGNVGGNVVGSVASVVGAVGSVTGNVGGNVAGSVASLTTNNDKTGYALTAAYDPAKAPDTIQSLLNDASPAAGSFKGAAALSSTDDFYNGSVLAFTSGALKGLARKVTDYTGATRLFTFSGSAGAADAAFPTAPADTDTFELIGIVGT